VSFVEFTGVARLDKRTKRLVKRLGPDDIAIIDHADLDRASAEELLESRVRVVFNVSPSVTGRFPNVGPLSLVRGGVRLIDCPDAALFEEVKEGESLVVRGGGLFRNGTRLASGHLHTEDELERLLSGQQARVSDALENFAENTLRHVREESRCRRRARASATATRSSWRAPPKPNGTCGRSAPTSASSSQFSSAWTGVPIASSKRATSPTS
jgi:uncharacterized membrane-anchored protein